MGGLLRTLFGLGGRQIRLDEAAWRSAMALPVFAGLDAAERGRLRDLAERLLADKTFSGAGGFEVGAPIATRIAALATLPVLHLDYEWYAGWEEIIVYPGEFVPEREIVDETGIVHHVHQPLSGEAWEGGPMVLSWQDVEWSGLGEGFNVVIHEFAHKLDMKNGGVNGLPVMHSGMRAEDWSAVFKNAYDDFCQRVDAGEETAIDPYASESPPEFFAVLSEYFFELPGLLNAAYPAVYRQLKRFYRQDPLSRLEPT